MAACSADECWRGSTRRRSFFASCQLDSTSVLTRSMSAVEFVGSAGRGDLVEIGTEVVELGHTSITIRCEVRNRQT